MDISSHRVKNEWHTLLKFLQKSSSTIPSSSKLHQNPQKNSHCAVIRSKAKLKRLNKFITVDLVSYLIKHSVLKSLCEDRKDGNRAIVRFFRRGIFQIRGNAEDVTIKLNSWVSTCRINGRRSLMKTNTMPSKPVAYDVIFPIDASIHISSTHKNLLVASWAKESTWR
jgi:hypothetical protein